MVSASILHELGLSPSVLSLEDTDLGGQDAPPQTETWQQCAEGRDHILPSLKSFAPTATLP